MEYQLIINYGGKKIEFGKYHTNERAITAIADKILKKMKYGEVLMNRRHSEFWPWNWWQTISRDKNWRKERG